jgi:hypothetical protein
MPAGQLGKTRAKPALAEGSSAGRQGEGRGNPVRDFFIADFAAGDFRLLFLILLFDETI